MEGNNTVDVISFAQENWSLLFGLGTAYQIARDSDPSESRIKLAGKVLLVIVLAVVVSRIEKKIAEKILLPLFRKIFGGDETEHERMLQQEAELRALLRRAPGTPMPPPASR